MTSISERVQRGAEWLDEVRPGWRDSIDLDKFDLRSSHQCACGQTFASDALKFSGGMSGYWLALKILQPDLTKPAGSREHGFLWSDKHEYECDEEAEIEQLNAEWRRVIHSGRVTQHAVEVMTG